MLDASAFSPDYVAARARFRGAALAKGLHVESHGIGQLGPDGEALTIDIARLGHPAAERVVLVTSGVHGIEGFLGSAVQAAVLEDALGGWRPPEDGAFWLVHGINPYGMAWGRRVNEDNVDLNRNFLLPDEAWRGAPPGYGRLDRALNPMSPPSRWSPLWPRLLWMSLRQGAGLVHAAAAGGQHERPRGLFFAGNGPSRSSVVVREQLGRWFGAARSVLHLDLHTGVGPYGKYLLLSGRPEGDERLEALRRGFGPEVVGLSAGASPTKGEFCRWMGHHLGEGRYESLQVEFGATSGGELLAALRDENRAHHHAQPDQPEAERARERLHRALNPMDRRWRDRVVVLGARLVQRALQVQLGATLSRSRELKEPA
jgi:hypothetical protein